MVGSGHLSSFLVPSVFMMILTVSRDSANYHARLYEHCRSVAAARRLVVSPIRCRWFDKIYPAYYRFVVERLLLEWIDERL